MTLLLVEEVECYLRPDVVASALDKNLKKGDKIIYLSPKGKKFDQKL